MTTSALRRGRHAAPRRHRWILVVAASLVVAVVLSLLADKGTYALWNDSASTTASTVSSGTADLVTGSLSAMNTAALGPGGAAVGTFTLANTGSVPLSLRVSTAAVSVAPAGASSTAALLAGLTVHLSVVASASACRAGLTGRSGALATFDTGRGFSTLPAGATGVGCVEIDLATTAPQGVAGAVATFSLTASGTQVVA